MPSAQAAKEWAAFSGPSVIIEGGSGIGHPSAQKDDSDILAACQTPAALTLYWKARYVALDKKTDVLVHVVEGTKKPSRSHKTTTTK